MRAAVAVVLVVALCAGGVAATSTAAAQSNNHADLQPPGNNTTTTNGSNTTPTRLPFGVVDELRSEVDGDSALTSTIVQSLGEGDRLYVSSVEYRDDFAFVTVVNARGRPAHLSVTDANSIDRSGGSGEAGYEQYTVPNGEYRLKVPATERKGDQTITIATADALYWFSDPGAPNTGSPLLPQQYSKLVYWATVTLAVLSASTVALASRSWLVSIVWSRRDIE